MRGGCSKLIIIEQLLIEQMLFQMQWDQSQQHGLFIAFHESTYVSFSPYLSKQRHCALVQTTRTSCSVSDNFTKITTFHEKPRKPSEIDALNLQACMVLTLKYKVLPERYLRPHNSIITASAGFCFYNRRFLLCHSHISHWLGILS